MSRRNESDASSRTTDATLPEESKSATVPRMARAAVLNCTPIPLTLTLSHGEREQLAADSVVREVCLADTALSFAERQRGILPLPEGEGRGEGKGNIGRTHSDCKELDVRWSPEGPYRFDPFIVLSLRLCRRSLTCPPPARSSSTRFQVWFPVCRLLRQQRSHTDAR